MSFEYFIGRRYLRAKRKQAFISLITILSTAGIAVGVMALIVVIAVMSGFESDLKSRILGGQSHIVLMRHGGPFTEYRKILKDVKKIDGVKSATPVIYTQVMLRASSRVSGAVLRGIDPESAGRVIKTLDKVSFNNPKAGMGESTDNDVPGIVLGKELANNLGVSKGDIIYLISPRGMISPIGHLPAMKRFRLTGFFESGMYDYDGSFAYINIDQAQKILRMGNSVTGIEIRVDNMYNAREIAQKIVSSLGFPFWARDWMQMNQNLFTALKLEKTVMFIILTLIVLVAAFNIASTLIMMVMEKTRDIAILKAMGATDKSIKKIFVFKGMVIGTVGTILGVIFGFVLCTILKHYKIAELTGDIYYFTTKLPVRLEFFDVLIIVSAALVICFFATIYPARQASKLDPVEAIRYG
ncbi:MAG: lipoprotein-releasing ABC transporter permease subunit [Desulfobacterales bacterium]|nr:lipoprotein-releasing ABC transporter permease subunit [Desulfobacterales bacterium]MDX2508703.1 lipoprotein-releasing ABC transporter permease subunit [Desulfobacterales bacterium]